MSLLRLLSAGKSLVGLKDSTSPYRMGHPRSMPRFGSGKNPFQSKASKPQPVAPAALSTTTDAGATSGQVPEPKSQAQAVSGAGETPSTPAVQKIEPKSLVAKPAKTGGSFLGLLWGPSRFLKRLRWSRKPKVAARQPLRRPVQVELSLDCVKVIRNDLSDADLEVVTARAPRVMASVEKAETRIKRQEKFESGHQLACGPNRTHDQLAEANRT